MFLSTYCTIDLYLQVIWGQHYKNSSSVEKGTLKHLEVLINRSNVPTVVKHNFNAAEDFLESVIDAHIIAAALEFFGMETATSEPRYNTFPTDPLHATDAIYQGALSFWSAWQACGHFCP